jgi:hypothetical protein
VKRSVLAIGLVLVLLVTAVGTLSAADGVQWKWQQPPDPVGWDVSFLAYLDGGGSTILADDWLCEETGRINNITFWVSWLGYGAGDHSDWEAVDSIRLSIYDDIPAGEKAAWSMPGKRLWWMTLRPGEYTLTQVPNGDRWQGWLNLPQWYPYINSNYPEDHHAYWRVDVNDIRTILKQQGRDQPLFNQREGRTYWLAIEMSYTPESVTMPGWKTTRPKLGWGDNAVFYGEYYDDGGSGWQPLVLPDTGKPLNLAFELTNREAQEPQPPPPPECIMHVQDIRGSVQEGPGGVGGYQLKAKVLVQDASGAPLAGVQVKAKVLTPDGTSAQESNTAITGWAQFTASSQQTGQWKLGVTDLVKEGCTYDPDANVLSIKTWNNSPSR